MYLEQLSSSLPPNIGTRYNAEDGFWVAKRVISLYLDWAAAVWLVTVTLYTGALARHSGTSYPSLPQRPMAFRGFPWLGSRILWLSAESFASIAIGRGLF
jgi:hypothetical protein